MIHLTSLSVANAFVNRYHRHLKSVVGHKFSIAFMNGNETLGVVIIGRPVNRNFDASVCEFTRVCVKGYYKNLLSMMLAAARKEAKKRGFRKAITYIRADENGASLKADNWTAVGIVKGRQWTGRKEHEIIDKIRYEHTL